LISKEKPQLLQTFHPFSVGLAHLEHLGELIGPTLPQNGHTLASGGTNLLQYLQGCL